MIFHNIMQTLNKERKGLNGFDSIPRYLNVSDSDCDGGAAADDNNYDDDGD